MGWIGSGWVIKLKMHIFLCFLIGSFGLSRFGFDWATMVLFFHPSSTQNPSGLGLLGTVWFGCADSILTDNPNDSIFKDGEMLVETWYAVQSCLKHSTKIMTELGEPDIICTRGNLPYLFYNHFNGLMQLRKKNMDSNHDILILS